MKKTKGTSFPTIVKAYSVTHFRIKNQNIGKTPGLSNSSGHLSIGIRKLKKQIDQQMAQQREQIDKELYDKLNEELRSEVSENRKFSLLIDIWGEALKKLLGESLVFSEIKSQIIKIMTSIKNDPLFLINDTTKKLSADNIELNRTIQEDKMSIVETNKKLEDLSAKYISLREKYQAAKKTLSY